MLDNIDNLIGEEGLKTKVTVGLESEVYFKLALIVVSSIVVGTLLSGIGKSVILGR